MIWQSPWAWLGLATVALPVIVHLFGRGHARIHRFPTLRFIDASRLLPTRRTRLNDLVLLALRASILVIAVAALAEPLLLTSRRSSAANAPLARVVILDTSASPTLGARAAIDSVLRANPLARDATASAVISTHDPSAALAGAVAWLETQPMRGEIAVVSRFQVGTLDSTDIVTIPARIGVRLVRVPSSATGTMEIHARSGGEQMIARVVSSADRTDVEWATSAGTRAGDAMPVVLAGAAERGRADAARAAATTIPVALPLDTVSPITVVEPGYEERASLLAGSIVPRRAWMMDIVARLAGDSMLVDAARRATVAAPPDSAGTIVVVRTRAGRPVILAAETTVREREHLTLYSLADAGSLTSAALFAAVAQATSLAPPSRELEPSSISDQQLASWRRDPAAETRPRRTSPNGTADGDSDGRWLWIAVLTFLALETWMRRERRASAARNEIARERAA